MGYPNIIIQLLYLNFNDVIHTNANKSFGDQKTALETNFSSWRGDLEQVDDVCVIGIKL